MKEKARAAQTYSPDELNDLGIRFGTDVMVHKSVLFFGDNVTIGSHVRIDCGCVITSGEPVVIGNHVHLGVGVCLLGAGAGVIVEDYVGLSNRVTVFTRSDDYSGGALTNPTIPAKYLRQRVGQVRLERHAIVGAGSVIMPGVTLHRGASVGALSFVNKSVPAFMVVAGNPLRKVGMRNRALLERLEKEYEEESRGA